MSDYTVHAWSGRVRTASTSTWAGVAITLALVVIGLAAPLLSSWEPTDIDFDAIDVGPRTAGHLLGTDRNGMDIWSRTIHAIRLDIGVAIAAVGIAIVIGSSIGAVIGSVGGWFDEFAMRMVDVVQAFPGFVLALAVVTLLGTSVANLIVVIALVNTPSYVRLMRSEVRSTREYGFVEAARCAGESEGSILVRHVVPNSLRPILVVGPLNCGWAILMLAGLSFLGLGVQVPEAEWGAMIASGAEEIVSGRWWSSVVPGIALFIAVLGFNLIGEGLLESRTGEEST